MVFIPVSGRNCEEGNVWRKILWDFNCVVLTVEDRLVIIRIPDSKVNLVHMAANVHTNTYKSLLQFANHLHKLLSEQTEWRAESGAKRDQSSATYIFG